MIKIKSIFFFCFLMFSINIVCPLTAQDKSENGEDDMRGQTDLKDIIKDITGSNKKSRDTLLTMNLSDRVAFSILPGISYNPATSFLVGVSTSVSWYFGDKAKTSNSNISASVSYSVKKQFKLSVQSSVFTKNNGWNLQGDFRLWKYIQNTYGLGTGTVNSAEQNMKFNMIRFNENIMKKLFPGAFAGIGYSLEYFYSLQTIDEDENTINPNIHNNYSKLHSIDSNKYISSGLVIDLNFDSRDNTINAYKGIMFDTKYFNYNKAIGSTTNWQKIEIELRAFHSVTKNKSYRVGLWLLGDFVLNGNVPYMSLSSNGWDKYNATARGYIQGRFRGRDLMYGEFENRLNLTKNGLLGLVVFVNAVTTSDPDSNVKLFDFIEPAGGVGLRIKFDKYSRTNISVDYGIGRYDSRGVFLTIGEFF